MFKVIKFESSGSRFVALFTREDEAVDYVELFAANPDRWKQEYRISQVENESVLDGLVTLEGV